MMSVTGRDLGDLSMFGGEGEVIFPHGSAFTVASAPTAWAGKSKHHKQIVWTNG